MEFLLVDQEKKSFPDWLFDSDVRTFHILLHRSTPSSIIMKTY